MATHRCCRPRRARRALAGPSLLATIVLLGVLPSASAASPVTAGASAEGAATASPDGGGSTGSIQYQESIAHEHDRLTFKAGGRVDVGFSPRSADRWIVGGVAPARLPAGRLDGATIRGQRTGGHSAPAPSRVPDRSIDLPTADVAPAEATSWTGSEPAGDVSADASIAPGQLSREVFGFLPYWEVGSSSLRLDQTKLSTIAYFGIGADAAGNLQKTNSDGTPTVGWKGWTSSGLTSVINTAHLNHTRVVLTIQSFGWNTTGAARQKALLGSFTARANLASQIVAAVRDRGVDGVNLDIEPLPSGSETGFTALVRLIRAKLNQVHAGYQLTFDTLGSIGNYPIEAATATGGADAIMIMGYDYRTASSSPVGSVAPLHKNGYDITDTVAAYRARVPASKLILGVPYYGRAWSTSTNTLNAANISGTKYGASTTVTYDTAVDFLAANGHFYDALENVAWTAYRRENCTATYGCQNPWRELYVDDATALGRKFDLINGYDLRGAGIWALGYDGTRPDFWNVIRAKFVVHTVRYAGSNRFATAAAVSARTFAPGVAVAYIANGNSFADALAGAAAAGTIRGPVLLANATGPLPSATAAELTRLKPSKVVILGGMGVIATTVERALKTYAASVVRYAGPDRYGTAATISARTFAPGVAVAYIANAGSFADALAGAAAAGTVRGPVLLASANTALNAATAAELTRLKPSKIVILGGSGVIGSAVEAMLKRFAPSVVRYAGSDRYATAATVSARTFAPGVAVAYIANGSSFPDALAGAAAAGTVHGPVLLTTGGSLSAATAAELRRLRPAKIIILGGTGVIGTLVERLLNSYATG